MPADRLFHPRLGHSRKVSALTDFEYRVWTQYQLSADDYGVMRKSAMTLQADNDYLADRPKRAIEKALDALVKVSLVRQFEHQGRLYVYQHDWQDFQHVGYPRATDAPPVPIDAIADCSLKTQKLFARHPSGVYQILAEDSPKISQTLDKDLPPSRTRETANGLRLMASDGKSADSIEARAGRLVEDYGEWYRLHRHGARHHARPNLDWHDAQGLCRTWDDARLEKLAALVLTTDDPFISGTDRSFKIFAIKATWADDRLRQWETDHGIAVTS